MANNNPRGRNWTMLLYPDDPEHVKVMERLEQGYNYCAILHDKDCWTPADELENSLHLAGVLKKAHYHVVLQFTNARYKNALCADLGVANNYVDKVGDINKMSAYLLHSDNPEKFQYDKSELFGPLTGKVCRLMVDKDEDIQILAIIDQLEGTHCKWPFPDFIRWVCSAGYWSTYRRSASTVKDLYLYYQKRYIEKE